jgi:3-hydroxyisobutyrate dehydrogenase-like beta-hydroxyacid dehydrogenase
VSDSVAVIGLGGMRRPLADTLRRVGFAVQAWNRTPLPAGKLGDLTACETLDEAVRCPTVLLVLADSDAVDDVLAEIDPLLGAGQVIVDLGSSDPARSRAHAERLRKQGVGWVDAPVSGGPEGAEEGTLAIMAGCEVGDLEQVREVLDALGTVVHVGGPGAGHTVKIVNQVIVGLALEAVAEALALAERAGLDPAVVRAALRGGSADSRVLQIQGARMSDRDFAPRGSVRTMQKDGHLGLAFAESLGLALPHLRSLATVWDELVASGRGDDDCTVLILRLLDGAYDAREGP